MGVCSSTGAAATSQQNGHAQRDSKENGTTGSHNTKRRPSNEGREDRGNGEKCSSSLPSSHHVCRGGTYAREEDVLRFPVPDDKVAWSTEYPDYEPLEFFAVHEIPLEEDKHFRNECDKYEAKWNAIDGHVNRVSYHGDYDIVDKLPRNPVGRTGIKGRGRLARWGPNHAADPVVTRWKRDTETGTILRDPKSGKQLLEFICIKRGDSGQWAIPGGFVDPGEQVFLALRREFAEEAMASEEWSDDQKKEMVEKLDKLFSGGQEVYKGYVDDPRNTDESWMESVAVNFHDDDGSKVASIKLQAGDDAVGVRWADVSSELDLYASHKEFVRLAAELQNAHW